MNSVLLKLLRIVGIYATIICLFLLIGFIAKIDLAIFLEPFKYIILFDLIHFYVLDSGKEVFTPQRGMIAFGVNIVLISTAHFLALLPQKESLRKALNSSQCNRFMVHIVFADDAIRSCGRRIITRNIASEIL